MATPPQHFVDASGQPVTPGPLLGRGGEGSVYALQGARAGHVAKIYHAPLPAEKQEKLALMARTATTGLLKITTWPVDTLHPARGGPVQGILMPRTPDRLHKTPGLAPQLRQDLLAWRTQVEHSSLRGWPRRRRAHPPSWTAAWPRSWTAPPSTSAPATTRRWCSPVLGEMCHTKAQRPALFAPSRLCVRSLFADQAQFLMQSGRSFAHFVSRLTIASPRRVVECRLARAHPQRCGGCPLM